MVMVTTVVPVLVKILSHPLFKRLLPSEKDRLGFGRIMGCVSDSPLLPRRFTKDILLIIPLHRIAKDVAAERFGPDKKIQKDMLGSFVAHGLTQKEAGSEILLQM